MISLQSFNDELEKISESDLPKGSLWSHLSPSEKAVAGTLVAGTVGGLAMNVANIARGNPNPIYTALGLVPTAGLLTFNRMKGKELLQKHRQKTKISKARIPVITGAMGAGVGAVHHGLREWDKRIDENEKLRSGKVTHKAVGAARKERRSRMAAGTALWGAAGAGVGAGGKRIAKYVTDHSSSAAKAVASYNADVLEQGFGRALKNSADEVGHKFGKGSVTGAAEGVKQVLKPSGIINKIKSIGRRKKTP